MDMIERVARVLCLANRKQIPLFHDLTPEGQADEIENGWSLWKPEARAAIEAMRGWESIETAPKDGTRILLWTTTVGDQALTEYLEAVDDEAGEVTCAQIGRWDFGNDSEDPMWSRPADWELSLVGVPSHWMPLPAPPAAALKPEVQP